MTGQLLASKEIPYPPSDHHRSCIGGIMTGQLQLASKKFSASLRSPPILHRWDHDWSATLATKKFVDERATPLAADLFRVPPHPWRHFHPLTIHLRSKLSFPASSNPTQQSREAAIIAKLKPCHARWLDYRVLRASKKQSRKIKPIPSPAEILRR